MRRNKLTIMSLILSVVMAMSLVVGCGAQGDATISEEPKEQVDADTVKTKKLDSFDYYQNWDRIFEQLL